MHASAQGNQAWFVSDQKHVRLLHTACAQADLCSSSSYSADPVCPLHTSPFEMKAKQDELIGKVVNGSLSRANNL